VADPFSILLKNPLLIAHGIVDNNVMFQKDFSQIYYPEESHTFVRDETLIDAFRRATEFFDRNLSGQ
jgi:dipeptidyl aminopeptidase/acylaminoacyl peptidase